MLAQGLGFGIETLLCLIGSWFGIESLLCLIASWFGIESLMCLIASWSHEGPKMTGKKVLRMTKGWCANS